MQTTRRIDSMKGCLVGTAVGDSVGLPYEGLSKPRTLRVCGTEPLHQRLILGRGMVSDDTEHTCMVAQALIASHGDLDRFIRSLAWRFRGWLAALPAGVGLATLRSIVRLWLGRSWRSSGVNSAGNGPAMRSAVLGLFALNDDALLGELVHRSSWLTHTDPRAEEGALLIALAARFGSLHGPTQLNPAEYLDEALRAVKTPEFRNSLVLIRSSLQSGDTCAAFADRLGLGNGVSGYVLHTVPICLYAWLRHSDDFRTGVEAVIRLGGDTDSTGAIVGALLGATLGVKAIPDDWLGRLSDWPRSVQWIERLAERLSLCAEGDRAVRPLALFWPGLLPRNLVFLKIVLAHGFRRLLPPY